MVMQQLPDINGRRFGHNAKPTRNEAIVAAVASGKSLAEVAKEFGLTPQRIHAIYRKAFLAQQEAE